MSDDVVVLGVATDDPAPARQVACPVCACPIEGDPVTCPRCATPHHADCWEYSGGCAIFGCTRAEGARSSSSLSLSPSSSSPLPAPTAELKSRLRTWSWMYRLHWATFASIGVGLGGTVIVSAFAGLLHAILAPVVPGYVTQLVALPTMVASFVLSSTALLAIVGYFVLFLPAWIVLHRLETLVGRPLVVPRAATRAVLDRVDMPWFGRAVQGTFQALSWTSLGLAGLLALMALFGDLLAGSAGTGFFLPMAAILVFMRLVFFSAFNWATEARLSYLVTTQNRLTASMKDH